MLLTRVAVFHITSWETAFLSQSGPKEPKIAQTVQCSLVGQTWSKNLVSQHHNLFGTPCTLLSNDSSAQDPRLTADQEKLTGQE